MIKSSFKENFTFFTAILFWIMVFFGGLVWADSNGVWHDAKDVRGGTFGSDEQPNTNSFSFMNPVTFNDVLTANFNAIFNGNVGIGTATPTTKLDVMGDVKAKVYYDKDNSAYYVDPSGISNTNRIDSAQARSSIYYDKDNLGYYVNPASTTNLNRIDSAQTRSSIYYDKDNTGYYVDPASTTILNSLCLNGNCRNTWPPSGLSGALVIKTRVTTASFGCDSTPGLDIRFCIGSTCSPYVPVIQPTSMSCG